MSEAALAGLIKRLETATQRLEEVAARTGGTHAPSHSGTPTAGVAGNDSRAVSAFSEILQGPLHSFVELSSKVGGLVQDQAKIVQAAFEAQKQLIAVAGQSKKPTQQQLPQFLSSTQSAIQQIINLREKNRASPLSNHLSTVSEGIGALGWVVIEPTPAPYVGEMRDSAQFWANRVIKEYKDKDKTHVDWANGYVTLLTELQNYVKKVQTTGLVWNAKGIDAQEALGKLGASASTGAGAGPAAPPPPPVGVEPSGSKPGAPATAALFSQLNSGGLTAGLRKVDKSEMTHKNPDLRAGSVVPAGNTPVTASTAVKKPVTAVAKPPKTALEGSKWVIENHTAQSTTGPIVLDKVELRHVIYIYGCKGVTIQVTGKVNAITIDNCKSVGLLVPSVVSTVDLINSQSTNLQITDKAPTVAIDKCDGVQLYLSEAAAKEVEILTSKSSAMNVLTEEGGDWVERPLPEQFRTTVNWGTGLSTAAVEHKG
ncbi:F-actin-capping protein subunit alpha [Gaertneriomyces sp. JEL0708]|nr:F-actin-capping protein subunit alpha [Gaertneriomyces sp. JEL0708]